jgi:putative endonuclease
VKQYCIYILASQKNRMLYIGVTSNLIKRIQEHQQKIADGFTKRYKVDKLVYYEQTEDVISALVREKQMKKWNRSWKIRLIEKKNPKWRDLYLDLIQ